MSAERHLDGRCAGTLGHNRMLASRLMPSMKSRAWSVGPVITSQPDR